ncbi:restriction endonuclease subunit S [Arthrobacter sp. ZGTC212]|uniref:restriction endonuclease subunit S n=1 Tax=Arthrobacter sp. ZGTC212 TaxID=2058899 RepID=UPI000CE502F0|nr:restriction endonuclease subunit S [Arthrobacter sp. ZGTC212]
MGDFPKVTLADVLAEGGTVKTGPFGTVLKAAEYAGAGVPIISVGEVDYGSLRLRKDTPHAPIEVTERLPEYVLRAGDIVFGRKGAVDRSAWVKSSEDGWFLGSDGIRLRLPRDVNSRFFAYQFQNPAVREWLLQHASGSTMLSLNQRILERVPLVVPEREVQDAIAEVLGALDDKIAANTKLTETIEQLGGTKLNLLGINQEPGGDAVCLEAYFDFNPRRATVSDEAVLIDMQALPTAQPLVSRWGKGPKRGGTRFMNGDTLLARITPCLENRKTGFVDFLNDGEVGIGSTEFIVIRSREGIPLGASYFVATSNRFRDFAIQNMVGTSGRQRVSAADIARFELNPIVAADLVEFGEWADANLKVLGALRDENRTLAATRDALLPQLMSGKLRVRDIENTMGEMV